LAETVGAISSHTRMTKAKATEDLEQVGRDTKYKPEYCNKIIEFLKLGHSVMAFAGSIGVARSSIYEWAKTYPEFSDALKAAQSASVEFWEKLLLNVAAGGKGNVTAVIFALKNRGREEWADIIATQLADKDGKPIDPAKPLDALEIARRVAFLLTQGDRVLPHADKPEEQVTIQ
jgi:hypothetical protein